MRWQIGNGGDQLLATLVPGITLDAARRIETYRVKLFRGLPRVKAFPQVRDLFLELRSHGARIALASSAKADEVQVYQRIARVVDLINAATSADDVQETKPEPDIFAVALARLGVSRAIVVGDTRTTPKLRAVWA